MTDDTADPILDPVLAPDPAPSGPAPSAPSDPAPSAPSDPNADPTPQRRRARPTTGPVQYKGDDLEPERGPGLGCFRFQLAVLVVFIALTPLTVVWNWPATVSTVLLFVVIGLLLTTGQTIIFLLRLVAADRRGRRVPLGGGTRTVGELEDAGKSATPAAPESAGAAPVSGPAPSEDASASAATTDRGLDPGA